MPKPMYVWTGTAWVSVASEVESLANFATQSYADSQPGSKLVVPTSVAVGSGSGSVSNLGAISFSGASSVSVNDAFSSTYDNYIVKLNFVQNTSDGETRIRLRSSGTDSTTTYYFATNARTSANTTIQGQGANTTTLTMTPAAVKTTGENGLQITLFKPFSAVRTQLNWQATYLNDGSNYCSSVGGGMHDTASSYTSFTIYPSAGTMTGTIRVYGLKNG